MDKRFKTFAAALIITGLMLVGMTGCGGGSSPVTVSETGASGPAAIPAAGKESGSGDAAAFKINIAVDSGTFAYPFWVAKNKGILEKYNIEADFQTYAYGIDTINAVQLDQADIGEAMDFAAVSRLGGASELQFISFIAGNKLGASKLYALKGSIKKIQDLSGKSVVVQKGTVNEYVWAQTYDKYGIDPKSVNPLFISSTAEGLALVKSGDADAIWAGADISGQVEELGGKSLGDYTLIGFAPQGFLMLKKPYLDKNDEGIQRLLKALKEAVAIINANPEEAANIVKDNFKIPVENIARVLKDTIFDIRLSQQDVDQLDSVAKWSIQNKLIKYDFNVRDYIYLKPLEKTFPETITYKK
ncbi:putative aliphatic sulfonates-binding protein precursor [Ruminiclostridium hungatei]|uniref:Putative aliphatic sulfonates-binding protein n=1 Tax=Ruminiclostridium hungatei TaxID=48256 RepID=A0A1V4SHC3_RUMHU|nr:ABC transporter substrate-binding protein [Ruminiclostridium hungatei]OPX43270.1 putative aliphatic sulfonates-binding protein precursor [Ruminiclostridium hungatei]